MSRLMRAWVCAAVPLLGGCLAAPIPHAPCYTDEWGFRTGAAARALNEGRVNAGTRDEVLLALGEPDVVTTDGRAFEYACQESRGRWIGGAILPAPGGAAPIGLAIPFGGQVGLFVEFDAQGRVVRQESVPVESTTWAGVLPGEPSQRNALGSALDAWMRREIGREAKPKKAAEPAPASGPPLPIGSG